MHKFLKSREAADVIEALTQALEYFEDRADADGDSEGFRPNKEMRLMQLCKEALFYFEVKARVDDAEARIKAEMEEGTAVNQFKNEHYRRGFADGSAGKPCYYGCHTGMRSTLEEDRAAYSEGWHDGRDDVRADYREDCKADAERTGRRGW